MTMFSRRTRKDLIVAVLAALLVLLVWAFLNDRLVPSHWREPIGIGGDGTLVLSFVKAAKEGDFPLFLSKEPHRLGAPFGADWNSWPITEEVLYWSTGQLARLTGLQPAVAAAMALAHVLAALSFYTACRLLGRPRFWSWVFSVLFGISYYIFQRSLGHLILGYCWHVPLSLLVAAYAFSAGGLLKNRRRMALAAFTCVAAGLQNPYFAFVHMQFLGIAALTRAWKLRSPRAALPAFAAVALTMLTFLSMQADTFADQFRTHRGVTSVERSYRDMEMYALKPFDLILPPFWRSPALNARMADYFQQRAINGEYPMTYMGVVASLAALALAGVVFRDLVLRKRLSAASTNYAVPALWLVTLGVAGGLLGLGAMLTRMYFLRGANRFSAFIIVLVFFFAADALNRSTRRWPRGLAIALGILLLLAAAWDLPPRRLPPTDRFYGEMWRSMQAFVSDAETQIGHNAGVFVLPVGDFPEAPPRHHEDHYAALSLYLPNSTLRFSNGDMKGDYRDAWQRRVERLPGPSMAAELRRLGFGGVVVLRDAYSDNGQAALAQLSSAGYPVALTTSAPTNFAFVPLGPPSRPGASFPLPETAGVTLRQGWNAIEIGPDGKPVLWTTGQSATIGLHRDAGDGPAFLNVQLVSLVARGASVHCNGKPLVEISLRPNIPCAFERIALPLREGENVLEIRTDRAGAPASELDHRIVAVCLKDFEVVGLTADTRRRAAQAEVDTARVQATGPTAEVAGPARTNAWGDKTLLEISAPGVRWREFRAVPGTTPTAGDLIGTAGWGVRRIELLPANGRFGVTFSLTPGATQHAEHAVVFSSHAPDGRGVTFERVSGQADLYQLYLGMGAGFRPVGTAIRLVAGQTYTAVLNVSETQMTLAIDGPDVMARISEPVPPGSVPGKATWYWGDWALSGRPFSGRIVLLTLGTEALPPP